MSELTDKIRARGFWRLVVRPEVFSTERVSFESLAEVVRSAQVRMRGWDFPHYRDPLQYGVDWIGSDSQFQHHLESWRFFTTGQFVDINAFAEDWRDESALHPPDAGWVPGRLMSVWQPLFRFTEFFEFAARLALSPAGDDLMRVRIETHGLQERQLVVDDPKRGGFLEEHIASIESFPYARTYRREQLVASARSEAVRATRELLLRFGWTSVSDEMLSDYQKELTGESG